MALDFMEKREELYDNSRFGNSHPTPLSQDNVKEGIGIDLYYPWAVIFT
ncbi:MAG: hypothetical protein LBQ59_03140 [Candidatus Peribacteria bacterium]|nr:hypothetical protein [Candidatus Peribacteria bacterium]